MIGRDSAGDEIDPELLILEYDVIPDEEVGRMLHCSRKDPGSISDVESMRELLQDEFKKNRRFLEKLKELSRKYRKALKKIEYQQLLITEMASALENERENSKNSLMTEDFAHVAYGSLRIEECEELDS